MQLDTKNPKNINKKTSYENTEGLINKTNLNDTNLTLNQTTIQTVFEGDQTKNQIN